MSHSAILRILARPQNAKRRNTIGRLRTRRPHVHEARTSPRPHAPHRSLVRRSPSATVDVWSAAASRRNRSTTSCVYSYNRMLAVLTIKSSMRPYLTQVLALVFIALVAPTATPLALSAQELRGWLLVDVVDSSGGAIPAAQITLAAEELAMRREESTDAHGEAHFAALSPATYSVEESCKVGFAVGVGGFFATH